MDLARAQAVTSTRFDLVNPEPVEPEWAMVTALFADIRGYTTFADKATARQAVVHLNAFFGIVIPVIERHGGLVHQLLGDGVLALFGAPTPLPSHPDSAVAAGAEMLEEISRQVGDTHRIGVGINSGLVLVGMIGAAGNWRFGVIGDPINVAARVQDATRVLDESLLVTEATRCLLERAEPALEARGEVSLKGKARPVLVHGLTRQGTSPGAPA